MANEFSIFKIESAGELISLLSGFDKNWVFRGQVCSEWALQPSIERLLPKGAIWPDQSFFSQVENFGLDEFKRGSHHFLKDDFVPKTKLGWLSLMQHHGAPTRLLDFSQSPFVALYFATEFVSYCDGGYSSVWAVNFDCLNESNKKRYREVKGRELCTDFWGEDDEIFSLSEDFSQSLVMVLDPYVKNQRLFSQQGTFLLASNFSKSLTDSLFNPSLYGDSGRYLCRIDFPHAIVFDLINLLGMMNINSNTIYPGIDGFSSAVKVGMTSIMFKQLSLPA
ncbi:FRG domain-containing protein [Aquitalea palustris]|uniref:FRG domain-containing protein n=1 Tax=Aquitalea palustris TaxID=2480983 RepID=A0A454JMM4_9NEIS|nr:FRG domain-containing protein [Aquitalea palustris]RMD01263.1 FRG domain-containing protein [Aquitalea palustris]